MILLLLQTAVTFFIFQCSRNPLTTCVFLFINLLKSMEHTSKLEESSFLSDSFLQKVTFADTIDVTRAGGDNVKSTSDTSIITVEAEVQADLEDHQMENFHAGLVSAVRAYFKDKPDTLDPDFLDLLGHYGNSPLGNIVAELEPELVTRNFAIIRAEASNIATATATIVDAWKRDLFPSLVGSYEQPYSEEDFEKALDRLHQLVLKRLKAKKELQATRERLAKKTDELESLLKQLLGPEMTDNGCLVIGEVKAKYEMVKAQQRLRELHEKEAQIKVLSSQAEQKAKTTEEEFIRLTLENAELSKKVDKLRQTKKIVDQLDQQKVTKIRELHHKLQWAREMANKK